MTNEVNLTATVPEALAGKRLDQILSQLFSDYSRSRLQEWIKQGRVAVDGGHPVAKTRLAGGEVIEIRAEPEENHSDVQPEPVPLEVLHEDEEIIVINKPSGLVMHPAAGNWSGTVQNGLLYRWPELTDIPRAGIVHRLDKDTTGLFVVARTLRAHKSLVDQLQEHRVAREYLAIVNGSMVSGGTVDKPIGRHNVDRKRMAVRENGKEAVSHYRIGEKFRVHTLVSVQLETGRTHQIRVHMSSIGYPLMGDVTYGGRPKFPPKCEESLRVAISGFKRQALHAWQLTLEHPESGEVCQWRSELPDDMTGMLKLLREDTQNHVG